MSVVTKKFLVQVAKKAGVKNISGLRKDDLFNKIMASRNGRKTFYQEQNWNWAHDDVLIPLLESEVFFMAVPKLPEIEPEPKDPVKWGLWYYEAEKAHNKYWADFNQFLQRREMLKKIIVDAELNTANGIAWHSNKTGFSLSIKPR